MDSLRPRCYSKEEFARRGEKIFERDIRPQLKGIPARHFVLIDIETGDFEVDASELAASDRLLARCPMRKCGCAALARASLVALVSIGIDTGFDGRLSLPPFAAELSD